MGWASLQHTRHKMGQRPGWVGLQYLSVHVRAECGQGWVTLLHLLVRAARTWAGLGQVVVLSGKC